MSTNEYLIDASTRIYDALLSGELTIPSKDGE